MEPLVTELEPEADDMSTAPLTMALLPPLTNTILPPVLDVEDPPVNVTLDPWPLPLFPIAIFKDPACPVCEKLVEKLISPDFPVEDVPVIKLMLPDSIDDPVLKLISPLY
jgi:hypothetical protein